MTHKLLTAIESDGLLSGYIDKIERGEVDPYSAADEVLRSGKLLSDWLGQ